MLNINGLLRSQWVDLEGAPTIYNLTINSPMSERVGLGFAFVRDKIGPSTEDNVVADFSYTIPTSESIKLSFGLKGGVNLLNVDYTRLNIYEDDADFYNNINNRLSVIVGAGAYIHKDDIWYLGLSAPNLIRAKHYDDIKNSEVTEEIHLYLIGGYVFNLSETAKFKPAVLAKVVEGAPLALDLSANFLFNKKLTLGAAYRLDAAVSGLAAFQVSDQIMIGYAYDYDTTDLGNYNSGSHEIFLRFEFITRVRSKINTRFF